MSTRTGSAQEDVRQWLADVPACVEAVLADLRAGEGQRALARLNELATDVCGLMRAVQLDSAVCPCRPETLVSARMRRLFPHAHVDEFAAGGRIRNRYRPQVAYAVEPVGSGSWRITERTEDGGVRTLDTCHTMDHAVRRAGGLARYDAERWVPRP